MHILANCLIGCPHSNNTKNKLNKINKNIKINQINFNNKTEFKNKYKLGDTFYNTFPQIFLINNKEKILIGGNDILTYILDKINKVKSTDCDIIIKQITEKLDHLSNTNILNVISILCNKCKCS